MALTKKAATRRVERENRFGPCSKCKKATDSKWEKWYPKRPAPGQSQICGTCRKTEIAADPSKRAHSSNRTPQTSESSDTQAIWVHGVDILPSHRELYKQMTVNTADERVHILVDEHGRIDITFPGFPEHKRKAQLQKILNGNLRNPPVSLEGYRACQTCWRATIIINFQVNDKRGARQFCAIHQQQAKQYNNNTTADRQAQAAIKREAGFAALSDEPICYLTEMQKTVLRAVDRLITDEASGGQRADKQAKKRLASSIYDTFGGVSTDSTGQAPDQSDSPTASSFLVSTQVPQINVSMPTWWTEETIEQTKITRTERTTMQKEIVSP